MKTENKGFESWCVIEIFGHQKISGKVSVEKIASTEMIRVDVPKTSNSDGFTKYYNPTSIYGLTPVKEDYAKEMAELLNTKPVNDYNHHLALKKLMDKKIHEFYPELQESEQE